MADDNIQSTPPPIPPAPPAGITATPPSNGVPAPEGEPKPAEPAKALSPLQYLKELVWPSAAPHAHQSESLREVVETIVFVVVLVLLLKSFAAEAFVIPTGSMAETLWGYQKVVTCPRCGFLFPVNCSQEVDPSSGPVIKVTGCTCPNCRYHIDLEREVPVSWNSGDRVLVDKGLYGLLADPERFDVVVFKWPGDESFPRKGPQSNHVPMNYIKRLTGKSGETIGIYYGDLYKWEGPDGDQPDEADKKARPEELWQKPHMHENNPKYKQALEEHKGFAIIRKRPDKVLATKRIVYDNDHPASDIAKERWAGGTEWVADQARGFRHPAHEGGDVDWLRYSHTLRTTGKELITDFMGYNSWEPHGMPPENWAGDLILECEVTVEKPEGELSLELSKGVDRFRARWDLKSGACSLFRQTLNKGGEEQVGETQATALKQAGTYRVRFANVDQRLTVWVDGSLPFGDGVAYEPPGVRGPNKANDFEPASIGVKGGMLTVHRLKLWRDTYYTINPGQADWDPHGRNTMRWSEPDWEVLNSLPGKTLYVQPGHYLCMGDNSPESSDGRSWGLVPERLMLGRALLVYYPFYCPWPPLSAPVNRVGPIK